MQRVSSASVRIDGEVVGAIERGLLILVGVAPSDDDATLDWMAKKCASLRIFPDEAGKMSRSATDLGLEALVVSQFTLYGSCAKGNRPSFVDAAPPDFAEPFYERFVERLSGLLQSPVPTGRFGADMQVELVNDGPVTLWLER